VEGSLEGGTSRIASGISSFQHSSQVSLFFDLSTAGKFKSSGERRPYLGRDADHTRETPVVQDITAGILTSQVKSF
jgi:hypothetical protein